ncbi:MAG: hypothetical protein ACR2PG_11930, partial [Hyphomicrobiaceae bacterium]
PMPAPGPRLNILAKHRGILSIGGFVCRLGSTIVGRFTGISVLIYAESGCMGGHAGTEIGDNVGRARASTAWNLDV